MAQQQASSFALSGAPSLPTGTFPSGAPLPSSGFGGAFPSGSGFHVMGGSRPSGAPSLPTGTFPSGAPLPSSGFGGAFPSGSGFHAIGGSRPSDAPLHPSGQFYIKKTKLLH